MKTPKYTDLHRYPRGWKKAVDTNVAETLERAKRELEEQKRREEEIQAEARSKTISLRKAR